MRTAKVLITGGSGYVARAIKSIESNVISCGLLNYFNEDNYVEVDLTDYKSTEAIFKEYEVSSVIHLAAFKSIGESKKEPVKYLHNNIVSSLNLIKLCEQYDIPMVFASTATLYATESNPYSVSKAFIESCLQQSKINYVTLRYYNIGGLIEPPSLEQKGNVFDILRACYNSNTPFTINKGSIPRDYSHVLDIAHKTLSALEMVLTQTVRKEFDVLSGTTYSLEEVLDTYFKQGISFLTTDANIHESPLSQGVEVFPGERLFTIDDIVRSEIQYGLTVIPHS